MSSLDIRFKRFFNDINAFSQEFLPAEVRLGTNILFGDRSVRRKRSIMSQGGRCGNGWTENPITGLCYKILYPYTYSWYQAKSKCAGLGGQLLSIRTRQENEFVKELMVPLVELEENPMRGFWMGGEKVDNRWQWTDGTNVTFFDWHVGQPNNLNFNQDCLEMWWKDGKLAWADQHCGIGPWTAVCKKSPTNRCNDGWTENPATESCYKILEERLSWENARSKCASLGYGSDLASVHNSQEKDFIRDLLKSSNKTFYWLGGSNMKVEGSWEWVDGSKVTFTDWFNTPPHSQPDGGIEDCLVVVGVWGWKWADYRCTNKVFSVCQMPEIVNNFKQVDVQVAESCRIACANDATCHQYWWDSQTCKLYSANYEESEDYENGFCIEASGKECMDLCYKNTEQCEYWNWSPHTANCEQYYTKIENTAGNGATVGKCYGKD